MAGRTISLADAGKWATALQKDMRIAAQRGLLSAAARLVQHIQTVEIPRARPQPVDKGIYRAGWRFQRTGEGAEVFNATPQAALIEDGVRAASVRVGRKMIDALAEWASRHGMGRGADARGAAWAIARSMQRRGIFDRGRGLRILAKALEHAPRLVREEVEREVAAASG